MHYPFVLVEDLIEIQELALLKPGEQWEDKTYCVQGAILDGVSNHRTV